MEITVKGIVFSGEGNGRRFIELSWVKKQIKEKMGFDPHPGTLNLTLPADAKIIDLLNKVQGMQIVSEEGYFPGWLYKALINGEVYGAVVRPKVPGYPKNVLEVVASVSLRERFGLKDGDEVELKTWLE